MNDEGYTTGVIYSSTIVYGDESPYQIALIDFEDGTRQLVRVEGRTAAIGDSVTQSSPSESFRVED